MKKYISEKGHIWAHSLGEEGDRGPPPLTPSPLYLPRHERGILQCR